MRRREFIAGLTLPLWTRAAGARDRERVYRIAVPLAGRGGTPETGPLLRALRKLGYVERESLRVDLWSANGDFERMPEIAAAIVRANPDAIFVASTEFARHIRDATNTIPVVAYIYEAVAEGFAESFARPGRNFTGVSWTDGYSIVEKPYDLLSQILPPAAKVALLTTKNNSGTALEEACKRAAARAGLTFVAAYLDSPVTEDEHRRAFAGLRTQNAAAAIVVAQVENLDYAYLIPQLAEQAAIPAVYNWSAATGGLIHQVAFVDWEDTGRVGADYLDRVLNGTKPAELPFHHSDRSKLTVNVRTARALGLTIPETVLARADEVIE